MAIELSATAADAVRSTLSWMTTETGRRLRNQIGARGSGPVIFQSDQDSRAFHKDLRNLGEAASKAADTFMSGLSPVTAPDPPDPVPPDPPPPPPDPPPPPPPATDPTHTPITPQALREMLVRPELDVLSGGFTDAPAYFTQFAYANSVLSAGGSGAGGIQTRRNPRVYLPGSWIDCRNQHKWGSQVYGPIGLWEGCRIFGRPQEHALYNKNIWGGHWHHVLIEDMGGQAIQVVMRWPHEVVSSIPMSVISDPLGTGVAADWLLEECVFLDTAPAGERKSYYLSFFESTDDSPGYRSYIGKTLQDIRVIGCHLESTTQDVSHGAMMVHGQRHVVIEATNIIYKNPNRAAIQVWDCDTLTIVGGRLESPSGNPFRVDVRNVGRVECRDVTGNWEMAIAGRPGSPAPWYFQEPIDPHVTARRNAAGGNFVHVS